MLIFCDSDLLSQHNTTFELHCELWVIDWLARQAYKVCVVMASYEGCYWAWGKTARKPRQHHMIGAKWLDKQWLGV